MAKIAPKWEASKTMFFDMTQKKKPKENLGKFLKTSHTGLSKSLEEYDKAAAAYDIAKTDLNNKKITLEAALKVLKTLNDKHAAYKKAMTTYIQTLNAEILKETQKEADVKSVWERGLKFLKKELEMFDANMDQYCAQAEQNIDDKRKVLSMEDKQVDIWQSNMQAALKKGLAAVAKIKALAAAAKTPELVTKVIAEYNNSIPGKSGRDICMQLVIAERVNGLRGTPDKIKQQMLPWNTANTHKLLGTATAANIVDKVKLFSTDVKAAVDWYGKATTK